MPAGPEPAEGTNKRTLGLLFMGVLGVFSVLFIYFVIAVVAPMLRPSPYFQELTEALRRQSEGSGRPDPLSVDLAVMMEYASADIRMAGVQIAFALVGGLFFAVTGVLLLAAGVTGALKLTAKAGEGQFALSTAVPGVACLAFGAIIVAIGVLRDVSRPMQGRIERPTGQVYRPETVRPPEGKAGGVVGAITKAEQEAAKNVSEPSREP